MRHDGGQFTPGPAAAASAFVPWIVGAEHPAFTRWSPEPAAPPVDPGPPPEIEAMRAEAYRCGFDAGHAAREADVLAERGDIARLAESLSCLKPEPAGPLALLLVETVDRLVRQVVGEVAIDPTLLLARARAAAELIAEEARPSALRLHPADHARLAGAVLPVAMIADMQVAPGSVLLETAEGWIEDGVAQRLDAVRAALTRIDA